MPVKRISRSATIILRGTPARVFPMFDAIEERKWAEGWEPEILFSDSGGMEEQMIFRTKPIFPGESDYLWIVTRFEPETLRVEYAVSTDQRVWRVAVNCREHHNGATEAHVTYSYTGLTNTGQKRNAEAMKLMFAHNLRDWEEAINRYLELRS